MDSSEIIELQNFQVPGCYGRFKYCDCLLAQPCLWTLIDQLPECFGLLYDQTKCSSCMVKEECQESETETNVEGDYEVYFEANWLKILSRYRKIYKSWPIEVSDLSSKVRNARSKAVNGLKGVIYLKSQEKGAEPILLRLPISDIERSPVNDLVSS